MNDTWYSMLPLCWLTLTVICCHFRVQVARRTKRSFLPWFITLVLVAAAWFKLFTLSSVLNKMSYQNIWCATGDNLDIKYTFDESGAVSVTCSSEAHTSNMSTQQQKAQPQHGLNVALAPDGSC